MLRNEKARCGNCPYWYDNNPKQLWVQSGEETARPLDDRVRASRKWQDNQRKVPVPRDPKPEDEGECRIKHDNWETKVRSDWCGEHPDFPLRDNPSVSDDMRNYIPSHTALWKDKGCVIAEERERKE